MRHPLAGITVVARTELLLPEPAEALGVLLGVPVPNLTRDGLPPLWHWLYLLDRPAQADLGRDGHPVRGAIPSGRCGVGRPRPDGPRSFPYRTSKVAPVR